MWMISAFLFYFTIDFVKSSVDYLQHPVKSCHIGDVVENECNKCLCTSKTVFECTPVECSRNKNQKAIEPSNQLCYPNQLYVQNLITCICTKDGRWPHKSCQDTFQSLPPSNVVKHKCTPDTYVTIDCNVCRCGPDGEVISERCTRNACEDESKRRINNGPNNVYSSCEIKNWYSLAPCQFCFCVHQNKLVCNTGNYFSQKLELGSYNLRVCGKDLIREAIELIPDNQGVLRYGNEENATTLEVGNNRAVTTTADPVIRLREDPLLYASDDVNPEVSENRTQQQAPVQTAGQVLDQVSSQVPGQDPGQAQSAPGVPPPLVDENSSYDREEYYSDSVEVPIQGTPEIPETPVIPVPTTIAPEVLPVQIVTEQQEVLRGSSTRFPYEEGDEMLDESKMEGLDGQNANDNENTNEIVVEMQSSTPAATTQAGMQINLHSHNDDTQQQMHSGLKEMAREGRSGESYQYVGNTLKINLPKVLNKVFQLALRKSMVSLSSDSKCVPGTTNMNKCNMCFCLKNSKLLCTNNNCRD